MTSQNLTATQVQESIVPLHQQIMALSAQVACLQDRGEVFARTAETYMPAVMVADYRASLRETGERAAEASRASIFLELADLLDANPELNLTSSLLRDAAILTRRDLGRLAAADRAFHKKLSW